MKRPRSATSDKARPRRAGAVQLRSEGIPSSASSVCASSAGPARVAAAPRPALGELREPALDEVEPGAVGGREVEGEARTTQKPAMDGRGLVGRGVVDDHVHIGALRRAALDEVEEAAEVLRPVALREVGDHVPRGDVEGGVEVGRAVAAVVVRGARRRARQQGRDRGRAAGAWTRVFSSTQSTTAASGGVRVEALPIRREEGRRLRQKGAQLEERSRRRRPESNRRQRFCNRQAAARDRRRSCADAPQSTGCRADALRRRARR